MAKLEKTVFISYRRADISWALLVYQYLKANEYDVFFDYTSISSGDFEQIIISNIKARAHFLIILTPSALERCSEPGDWLRREIETAISEKRNIIPLFFGGFNFGNPEISKYLSGKIATIKNYNGLEVPASYFDAAMERLRNQYLNIALDAVLHPISDVVKKVVEEQKVAADKAISQDNMNDRLSLKGMEFCRIPAGTFQMGSDGKKDIEANDDEKPHHTVNISYDYWLAKFPLTNEQYNNFVQDQDKVHPVTNWKRRNNHPVVLVTWNNAISYCRWLIDIIGSELPKDMDLRLPTEAEWEKAAKGTEGYIYPWGDVFNNRNCNTDEGGMGVTTSVGAFSPDGDSSYGCADMSGNVWEWTHSQYKPYPYQADDGREDEEISEKRVLRGGSYNRYPIYARCSYRDYYYPVNCFNYIGFRVAFAPKLNS